VGLFSSVLPVDVLSFYVVEERHSFVRTDANEDRGERDVVTNGTGVDALVNGTTVIQIAVVFGTFWPLVHLEAARGVTVGEGF
jgi:hypothetical protein